MGLDMYGCCVKEDLVCDLSEVDPELCYDLGEPPADFASRIALEKLELTDDGSCIRYEADVQEVAKRVEARSQLLVARSKIARVKVEPIVFHYWRKHPDLFGWFAEKYMEKGGSNPDFNCTHLHLNRDDLALLKTHIETGLLPSTTGFFFGESSGQHDEVEDDLLFIQKANLLIDAGYRIYFRAWY